jgi:predicted membrane protein (TIGR00267 family)
VTGLGPRLAFLLRISESHDIIRRYFVVNGFDGALTMLGIVMGFALADPADIQVVISACLGAAIALGVSGVSSAYISEVAERRKSLRELEQAMIRDLDQSAHGDAARWMPLLVGLVNGLSPLLISLLIMLPLWLARAGIGLPLSPLLLSMVVALTVVFLLGVFLGRISGVSWLRSGLQTIAIAAATISLVYLFG